MGKRDLHCINSKHALILTTLWYSGWISAGAVGAWLGRIWSKINCECLFLFWRITLVVIFKKFLFQSFPYPLIWNSISKIYITKEVKNWLYDINHSAANKTKYSGPERCFFYDNEYQHSQKQKDFTINLIYWYLDSNSIVPKKWKKKWFVSVFRNIIFKLQLIFTFSCWYNLEVQLISLLFQLTFWFPWHNRI